MTRPEITDKQIVQEYNLMIPKIKSFLMQSETVKDSLFEQTNISIELHSLAARDSFDFREWILKAKGEDVKKLVYLFTGRTDEISQYLFLGYVVMAYHKKSCQHLPIVMPRLHFEDYFDGDFKKMKTWIDYWYYLDKKKEYKETKIHIAKYIHRKFEFDWQ